MTNLQQWLEGVGLAQYAELFAQNNIDEEILPDLNEQDLEKLGISLGHRKRLLKAIAEYRSAEPQPPARIAAAWRAAGGASIKAERRHLTVLFCDLVGSTALSAHLDPEDLRKILHDFQNCCSDAIARYAGHVARLLGDGVLAYFGFPKAHEDDAERAINAALQIIERVSAITVPTGRRLEVRIGIATGLVVVGDLIGEGPAQEFALVGEAPNLAARLQSLAEPNQVLIAHQTRRLIGGLFDLVDLSDHTLRGFDRPVRVWSVLKRSAVTSRFEASRSPRLTPLVGRERELGLLEQRCAEASRGKGQVVAISGEPGIGKSRLIMALKDRLSGKMACPPSLQCSAHYQNSALYPFIRYLEEAAGIAFDMPAAQRLDRLTELLQRHAGNQSEAMIPVLAGLLSIPTGDRYAPLELTPHQQKSRTFAALLKLFEGQADENTVLLIFEDVHWIDPTSWELVERIRDHVKNWRILVILLFRPEFLVSWESQPHITSLAINRLDAAQVASVIQSLGRDVLPQTIVDQIIAKADGVPLFVEEMTKAVLETKTLAGAESAAVGVPDTLHDSLMARLDQLASMKAVAQMASVIGREFSLDLLEAVASPSELDLQAGIDRLISAGLLFQRPAVLRTYIFSHALVQDEAYDSLLRDDRRELHIKIADILCARFSDIAESSPELVAHHYTQARAFKPAVAQWLKAGRVASRRSAFVEAIRHFQLALNMLSELPPGPQWDELELQLQHSLGSAFIAAKGFGADETKHAFERALELCDKFEGAPQTFAVRNGMVGVHLMRGEFEKSRDRATDLLARARRQDDPTPRLMGHRALGMSLFMIGELVQSSSELQKAIALYDVTRHGPMALVFSQDFKATAEVYLSLASVLLGDIKGGLDHGVNALAHAEALRHPHSICYVLPFLAGSHLVAGMAQAALPLTERTIALASEYGFPLWSAGGLMLRGWARLDLGDVDEALIEIRQSVSALEATGTLVWVQFARFLLARAMAKARHTEIATHQVEQLLNELGATSGRWYQAEVHRLYGELLIERGDTEAGETCFEAAIEISARQGARVWQLRATNALSQLLREQGRTSELHARLAPLYSSFDSALGSADLQRAKLLLAEPG
jgi:class 3 adenylate cyclase/tetratricopeptide (TPR) repeat protein